MKYWRNWWHTFLAKRAYTILHHLNLEVASIFKLSISCLTFKFFATDDCRRQLQRQQQRCRHHRTSARGDQEQGTATAAASQAEGVAETARSTTAATRSPNSWKRQPITASVSCALWWWRWHNFAGGWVDSFWGKTTDILMSRLLLM